MTTPAKRHDNVTITYEAGGVVAKCTCGWERYDPTPSYEVGVAMWRKHKPAEKKKEQPDP